MKDFTILLREHNLKATPQRLAIMDIINSYGHINVDTLYKEVQKKFSSISLATIYKNINAMTENLLLLEVKLPDTKSVYEVAKHQHSHLLCKKCHKVIDVEVDTSQIVSDISKEYQFDINGSDVVLFGTCPSCQK